MNTLDRPWLDVAEGFDGIDEAGPFVPEDEWCVRCGENRASLMDRPRRCKRCRSLADVRRRGENPLPPGEKAHQNRWAKYRITRERFDAMLSAQDGKCGICRTPDPGKRGWHIDHDHACCPGRTSCGKCVRGLLCHGCNAGLGMFRDDPAALIAAAQYLTEGGTR